MGVNRLGSSGEMSSSPIARSCVLPRFPYCDPLSLGIEGVDEDLRRLPCWGESLEGVCRGVSVGVGSACAVNTGALSSVMLNASIPSGLVSDLSSIEAFFPHPSAAVSTMSSLIFLGQALVIGIIFPVDIR